MEIDGFIPKNGNPIYSQILVVIEIEEITGSEKF